MSSSTRTDEVELHLLQNRERASSPVPSNTSDLNPDSAHLLENAECGRQEVDVPSDEDGYEDELSPPSTPRFMQPQGRELGFIIASAVIVLLLSLAAGLTTVFDWVL